MNTGTSTMSTATESEQLSRTHSLSDSGLLSPHETPTGRQASTSLLITTPNRKIDPPFSPTALSAVPSNQSERTSPINISPATSNRSMESYRSLGPFCRICHEDEKSEALISPCWCNGSMGLVHKSCLERWLTMSNCEKCELCHFAYTVERRPKPIWKFLVQCDNPNVWRAILVDTLCLFLLTPLAILSIYLCVLGAMQYANPEQASSSNSEANYPKPKPKYHIVKIPRLRTEAGEESRSFIIPSPEILDEQGKKEEDFEKELLEWEALGLIILAVLLLGIFAAWATAVIGYHIREWRHWRMANQELVLIETSSSHGSCRLSVSTLSHSFQITPVSLNSVDQQSRAVSTESAVSALESIPHCSSCGERVNEDNNGQGASGIATDMGMKELSSRSILKSSFGSNKNLEELDAAILCRILAEQKSTYVRNPEEVPGEFEDLTSPAFDTPVKEISFEHKF